MNYKLTNQRSIVADIHEVKTNQTIRYSVELSEARAILRHLNFGGGFDGWTPAFFTQTIVPTGE